jgi:hypothetical protein
MTFFGLHVVTCTYAIITRFKGKYQFMLRLFLRKIFLTKLFLEKIIFSKIIFGV